MSFIQDVGRHHLEEGEELKAGSDPRSRQEAVTHRVPRPAAQVFCCHQQSVQRGPPAAQGLLPVPDRQQQSPPREPPALLPQLQL